MVTTPPSIMATCAGRPAAGGTTDNATFVAVPISTMFRIVPTPGRSPSGHQAARMGIPTRMLTVPSSSPVILLIPWWKASHGPRPRPARTMRAMPMPKTTSPAMRPGRRGRTAPGLQRSVAGVTGAMVPGGRA